LTVVGATSGDTGSAAIYGLRGKKDVSVFILHPKGRVSPIQEAQMTTVLDANVHNVAVTATFDDCQVCTRIPFSHALISQCTVRHVFLTIYPPQDIVKALFTDPDINKTHSLGAVNSINWARILAQIVYYFHSYFSLAKASPDFKIGDKIRFVVPTGNFGDVLAGYFAYRMGLPVDRFVVATNENDILDRFFRTGVYEKQAPSGGQAAEGGVKETLSPAMDILVSSNFERLIWFLAREFAAKSAPNMDEDFYRKQAGHEVSRLLGDLKTKGGFGPVYRDMLTSAQLDFESERVSDPETVESIRETYRERGYVLDPHSAVGVAAAWRSVERTDKGLPHVALSTAHPAKFAEAVEKALGEEAGFDFNGQVLPKEFVGLDTREKRVVECENRWEAVRELIREVVGEEMEA
jgi:threonine synthase